MNKESKYNSHLRRFFQAQEDIYETILSQIKAGVKDGCWMWYIFPQLRGIGESIQAKIYGIINLEEAKDYLDNKILGKRLFECCEALLELKDLTTEDIFDDEIDALKLQASMTLFLQVSESNSIFQRVLDKYFNGQVHEYTIALLNKDYCIENGVLKAYYGFEENISIPETVTEVIGVAFIYCNNIKSVIIPKSVTKIGKGAFAYCENMKTLTILNDETTIEKDAFRYSRELTLVGNKNSFTHHYATIFKHKFEEIEKEI